MADSDGEYVVDSDDDVRAAQSANGTRAATTNRGTATKSTRGDDSHGKVRRRAAWEDIQRSWDTVVESADGSINSTVDGLRDAGKRQR